MSTEERRAVHANVDVRAEPDRVYRALTNRDQLERWYAFRIDGAFRLGGTVRCIRQSGRPEETLTILAMEPPHRLIFQIHSDEPSPTIVEMVLVGDRRGTRVRLSQSDFGAGDRWHLAVVEYEHWWAYYLHALKWHVEEGFDQRSLPFLGFGWEADISGLHVLAVPPGSPAQTAGLQVGDLVTRINDHRVSDLLSMRRALRLTPVGDRPVPVHVVVQRNGTPVGLTILGMPLLAQLPA